ncbi:MAG: hypothetical protein IPM18_17590 [Phycisphaerales bacterium]|nr:hypothetical protein [Phycisphaerales bacterium]
MTLLLGLVAPILLVDAAQAYYTAGLGRFLWRDPYCELGSIVMRERDGRAFLNPLSEFADLQTEVHLYAYVLNRPTDAIDPFGLNLYAIDGTWASWGQGTNTEWIYRLTRETKYYWNGPSYGLTGMDSVGIARGVHDQICRDLQNAAKKCATITINLVGWSRGASVAIWVAHKLNREGCKVCGNQVYPIVDWLGLFDAVDQSPGIPNWAMSNPPNALVISHAVKTSTSTWEWTKFPTAPVFPQTLFWRKDGSGTTHGDIGANKFNNNAFFWMRSQAKAAGVKIK